MKYVSHVLTVRKISGFIVLYMRILDWPPMRKCLLDPWAESGIVMKETWESVRALVALLEDMKVSTGYVDGL